MKILLTLITLALVYPLALAVQIAVDTGLGDGAFAYALAHERTRPLVETLLGDALYGTATVAVLFAVLLPAGALARRSVAGGRVFLALPWVLLASPLLPGVPLMAGLVAGLSALAAGLLGRRVWA